MEWFLLKLQGCSVLALESNVYERAWMMNTCNIQMVTKTHLRVLCPLLDYPCLTEEKRAMQIPNDSNKILVPT